MQITCKTFNFDITLKGNLIPCRSNNGNDVRYKKRVKIFYILLETKLFMGNRKNITVSTFITTMLELNSITLIILD